MGVCIETMVSATMSMPAQVTPYMGVCIETLVFENCPRLWLSHPIWVCVLKHN